MQFSYGYIFTFLGMVIHSCLPYGPIGFGKKQHKNCTKNLSCKFWWSEHKNAFFKTSEVNIKALGARIFLSCLCLHFCQISSFLKRPWSLNFNKRFSVVMRGEFNTHPHHPSHPLFFCGKLCEKILPSPIGQQPSVARDEGP